MCLAAKGLATGTPRPARARSGAVEPRGWAGGQVGGECPAETYPREDGADRCLYSASRGNLAAAAVLSAGSF